MYYSVFQRGCIANTIDDFNTNLEGMDGHLWGRQQSQQDRRVCCVVTTIVGPRLYRQTCSLPSSPFGDIVLFKFTSKYIHVSEGCSGVESTARFILYKQNYCKHATPRRPFPPASPAPCLHDTAPGAYAVVDNVREHKNISAFMP